MFTPDELAGIVDLFGALTRAELAEALFANHDLFTLQSAEEFKALLSAQAVLSPAATLVATAADWAAGQGADADTAEAFLRSLVAANLSASTLENSNVDIATEFSNLIITQRAYSASSRIITTADEMLNEAIQMKR